MYMFGFLITTDCPLHMRLHEKYGRLSLLAANHNALKAPISQIAASEYFSLLGKCLQCLAFFFFFFFVSFIRQACSNLSRRKVE